jgi:hypothetical protein
MRHSGALSVIIDHRGRVGDETAPAARYSQECSIIQEVNVMNHHLL